MNAQDLAKIIAGLSPQEREQFGEELLDQLSLVQIAELLAGLAKVGQDRSFPRPRKVLVLADMLGDTARRFFVEDLFSLKEERQGSLW